MELLGILKNFFKKISSVEYLTDSANSLAAFYRVACVVFLSTDVWVQYHEDVWECMPCLFLWIGIISFLLILFFCDLNSVDAEYAIAFSNIFLATIKKLYYYFYNGISFLTHHLVKFTNVFLSFFKSFLFFWRPLFKKSGYFFKYIKNKFF